MRYSGIFGLLIFLCTQIHAQDLQLGEINFPVTVKSEAAKAAFIEGALLLHSFEYEDAREAFQKAQEIEPDFFMAYWGEAMTHNHPIWMRQYKEEAIKALEKLGKTPEERSQKAPTEKEGALLNAVERLYGAKVKEEGDYAYCEAMENLHLQYPEDLEIASFYALSILGTSHGARDLRKYMKSASIVERVYEKNPNHPGALHYLIHSYDDPVHAVLGLRAAERYAKVAPAAAHALHMPSHIFVAIGDWDRVVASNEDSWRASLARQERKALDLSARGYHSFWWLAYGYLQLGDFDRAALLLDSMQLDAKRSDDFTVEYHLTVMRAAHLIDTEDWDSKAVDIQPDMKVINKKTQAIYHYTNGIVSWKKGNISGVGEAIEKLQLLLPKATALPAQSEEATASCCAAPGAEEMGEQTRLAIEVMTECLSGIRLYMQGNKIPAQAVLRSATQKEEKLSFSFGPPAIVKPSHEVLGEIFLAEGKEEEAQKVFEAGLLRAPERRNLKKGLIEALLKMAQDTGRK